jgi:hypothetical protein
MRIFALSIISLCNLIFSSENTSLLINNNNNHQVKRDHLLDEKNCLSFQLNYNAHKMMHVDDYHRFVKFCLARADDQYKKDPITAAKYLDVASMPWETFATKLTPVGSKTDTRTLININASKAWIKLALELKEAGHQYCFSADDIYEKLNAASDCVKKLEDPRQLKSIADLGIRFANVYDDYRGHCLSLRYAVKIKDTSLSYLALKDFYSMSEKNAAENKHIASLEEIFSDDLSFTQLCFDKLRQELDTVGNDNKELSFSAHALTDWHRFVTHQALASSSNTDDIFATLHAWYNHAEHLPPALQIETLKHISMAGAEFATKCNDHRGHYIEIKCAARTGDLSFLAEKIKKFYLLRGKKDVTEFGAGDSIDDICLYEPDYLAFLTSCLDQARALLKTNLAQATEYLDIASKEWCTWTWSTEKNDIEHTETIPLDVGVSWTKHALQLKQQGKKNAYSANAIFKKLHSLFSVASSSTEHSQFESQLADFSKQFAIAYNDHRGYYIGAHYALKMKDYVRLFENIREYYLIREKKDIPEPTIGDSLDDILKDIEQATENAEPHLKRTLERMQWLQKALSTMVAAEESEGEKIYENLLKADIDLLSGEGSTLCLVPDCPDKSHAFELAVFEYLVRQEFRCRIAKAVYGLTHHNPEAVTREFEKLFNQGDHQISEYYQNLLACLQLANNSAQWKTYIDTLTQYLPTVKKYHVSSLDKIEPANEMERLAAAIKTLDFYHQKQKYKSITEKELKQFLSYAVVNHENFYFCHLIGLMLNKSSSEKYQAEGSQWLARCTQKANSFVLNQKDTRHRLSDIIHDLANEGNYMSDAQIVLAACKVGDIKSAEEHCKKFLQKAPPSQKPSHQNLIKSIANAKRKLQQPKAELLVGAKQKSNPQVIAKEFEKTINRLIPGCNATVTFQGGGNVEDLTNGVVNMEIKKAVQEKLS